MDPPPPSVFGTDGELAALREECAAKDARIAELLAKVASAVA